MSISNAISQCKKLENITIGVNDVALNTDKAALIDKSVVQLPIMTKFTFVNIARKVNYYNNEYKNFFDCFPLIKIAQRFLYSIKWGKKWSIFQSPKVQIAPLSPQPTNQTLDRMLPSSQGQYDYQTEMLSQRFPAWPTS